ncbi:MbnP family copper-binding protein [Aliikangiella coralliicola]|uniref:MbnP family copper-binding protein n=1 Tax=Aliikangiella coralliicola TaxID=2592383 RepID=UPI00143D0BE2|nr:MbnP family copper-binding protein [Aliikangiella coralliicola]
MLSKKSNFCSNVKAITFLVVQFLLLSGCQKNPESYSVDFAVYYGSKKLDCKTVFEGEDTFEHQGQVWRLSQLQFFIHDVQLKSKSGQWHQATPVVPEKYSDEVFLIGSGCGQQQNWQIKLTSLLAKNEISGIKFIVGVPPEINHKNPLTLAAPLNQPDMFWTWQLGHKFIRMEFANSAEEWIFHLGSTGCRSPSPVRPPKEACKNPNAPKVVLNNFSAKHHVALNISAFLEGIDMQDNSNCQSSLDTPACQLLLPRVGIAVASNLANSNSPKNLQAKQKLFESRR